MERGWWYKLLGVSTFFAAVAAILVVPEVRWYLGLDALLEEYCYSGTWKENVPNPPSWTFSLDDDTLQIKRDDGFVAGTFVRSGDNWVGSLAWNNGERWNNVVLYKISRKCKEVRTNQRWWYRRE